MKDEMGRGRFGRCCGEEVRTGYLSERRYLEELGIDKKKLLKLNFKKWTVAGK
jgi:hypothetical protein